MVCRFARILSQNWLMVIFQKRTFNIQIFDERFDEKISEEIS